MPTPLVTTAESCSAVLLYITTVLGRKQLSKSACITAQPPPIAAPAAPIRISASTKNGVRLNYSNVLFKPKATTRIKHPHTPQPNPVPTLLSRLPPLLRKARTLPPITSRSSAFLKRIEAPKDKSIGTEVPPTKAWRLGAEAPPTRAEGIAAPAAPTKTHSHRRRQ